MSFRVNFRQCVSEIALRLVVVSLCVLVGGCFRGEPPLPPHEALARAADRINAILREERSFRQPPASSLPPPASNPKVNFWFYAHPLISAGFLSHPDRLQTFAAEHPEVKLTHQYIGDWNVAIQKLTVCLAAGDMPDIALVKRAWLARLIPSGLIAPLDDIVPASLIEDLRAPLREAFTANARLFALPADGFCSVLYYNRTQVPEPPPADWDSLRAAVRQATQPPASYGLGYLPFLETLWSAGGQVCDEESCKLNTPEAREALDFILSLRDEKLAHPRVMDAVDGLDLFLAGRVAMTVASSEYLSRVQKASFPVGIGPVPGMTGPISQLSDSALVVFAKDAATKRSAIAAVLDFLTGPSFQGKEALAIGSLPVRTSIAQDLRERQSPDGALTSPAGFEQAFSRAKNTPLVGPWGAIEFELARHLDLAFRWKP